MTMNDRNLKILVLGSGGREHTLAKICSRSDFVEKVMVAPGNGGMSQEFEAFALKIEDNSEIVRLAKEQGADLVVVGPEVPLCNGAVDALNEAGILAYGPDQAGARLEGSKAYTKDFLKKYDIPTAAYGNFCEVEPALAYLSDCPLPVVVKASGLAAGKGVLICQTREEAAEGVAGVDPRVCWVLQTHQRGARRAGGTAAVLPFGLETRQRAQRSWGRAPRRARTCTWHARSLHAR